MLLETHQPHVQDRRTGSAEPVPERAAAVRFLFVNGRTPRGNPHCALCGEEIGGGYVREIATGLVYCNRHYSVGRTQISEFASRSRGRIVS